MTSQPRCTQQHVGAFLQMTAYCTVLSILLKTKSNSKMTWSTFSNGLLIGVFNTSKCFLMTISSGSTHLIHFYELCGVVLKCVENEKYPEVTLSHDLTWGSHIAKITTKTNQKLWFIKGDLRGSPHEIKCFVYIALSMQLRSGISPL